MIPPSRNHYASTCVIPNINHKAVQDVMTTRKAHRSEMKLNSRYSCHVDNPKEAFTQRMYENVDNIVRRGIAKADTKRLSSEDEMKYPCDSYSGNFSLDTCRPEPLGCDDTVCDVYVNDSLTTVSNLSDNSGLDFNTPAVPRMKIPLRTPGCKWDTDETTFAALPAANEDTISVSSSDSDDVMSMSAMAAAIEVLQQQLEVKKQKMKEKNRRRSCPQTNTMSSHLL